MEEFLVLIGNILLCAVFVAAIVYVILLSMLYLFNFIYLVHGYIKGKREKTHTLTYGVGIIFVGTVLAIMAIVLTIAGFIVEKEVS